MKVEHNLMSVENIIDINNNRNEEEEGKEVYNFPPEYIELCYEQ